MIKSKQIQRPQLVLVVDDQEINRDVLGLILEDDYDVIFAENGREALELMRERLDELSIVLLDLMMPVMNGFEVMEAVRADDQLRQVPIIVLTAEKSAELKALQMGAADFITKPFDAHEVILARVGRIIELNEGKKLISAAEHDQLTMLYSRNFFFEYANRLYQYHPELQLDAIVMNIEQFHSINALNGRAFGDDVLRILGNEIRGFPIATLMQIHDLQELYGDCCKYLEKDDVITLEAYTLQKDYFAYLVAVALNGTLSSIPLFSPQPANCPTNIRGDHALGYFAVCPVASASVTVDDPLRPYYRKLMPGM